MSRSFSANQIKIIGCLTKNPKEKGKLSILQLQRRTKLNRKTILNTVNQMIETGSRIRIIPAIPDTQEQVKNTGHIQVYWGKDPVPPADAPVKPDDTSAGIKHDANKPRTDLVFTDFRNALMEVAKVGTAGAEKYSDSNWLLVENGIERYRSAAYRHLLQPADTINEDDFDLLHMAHAAWSILAALELILRNKKG